MKENEFEKGFLASIRRLVYLLLISLIFSFPQKLFGQQYDLSIYKSHFDNELKPWTITIKNFKLATFKLTDSISFEDLEYNNGNLDSFLSIYKPALTFSKDRTKFIDIYSYGLNLEKKGNKIVSSGSEVDQAISFCNMATEKWTQILFCGASLYIQDVIWLTETKFMLVGSFQNEEVQYPPVIYLGDIARKSFQIYHSSNRDCLQKSGYESIKLTRLNIHED